MKLEEILLEKENYRIVLSIIIPVYNVEKYVSCCLESVISQNSSKIEIIIVNDGSTDNSLSICNRYVQYSNNIKVINQANQGLSEARNVGIKYANGEYLMFLDSDDYLAESCINRIINEINNNKTDILLGRALKFEDGFNKYTLCQVDYSNFNTSIPCNCFRQLNASKGFWFAAWLVIIKKAFLLKNNIFFKKGILHEDELWVPIVFAKARSISFLNFGFYCYRVGRTGSIMFKPNIQREFDKLIVIEELSNLQEVSFNAHKMLSERCASLLFGIVLRICKFEGYIQRADLKKEVKKRLHFIKIKKYFPIYVLCHIIGVINTSKILNFIFKKRYQNL